ncbi:MAG: hypothetical protein QM608_05990 [Caulobacter sp.]
MTAPAYDLDALADLCAALGFPANRLESAYLQVDLGAGAILCFDTDEDGGLIGFAGGDWHTHGDVMFGDARGYSVSLTAPELLSGLAEGRVLVRDREADGRLVERSLLHIDYPDIPNLAPGERVVLRRAEVVVPS